MVHIRTVAEEQAGGHRTDVQALLSEPDPIARHVLADTLRNSPGILLLEDADRAPADEPDVVVVAAGDRDDPAATASRWLALQIPVLLLGVAWELRGLDAAFAAGAAGCLVKNTDFTRLGAAVQAVAHGHMVLSPELIGLYTGSSPGEARARQQPPADERTPPAPTGNDAPAGVETLTVREREVLEALASGMTTGEAARWLGVSSATVKSHVSHTLTKLGARNRVEAVLTLRRAQETSTQLRTR